MLADLIRVIPWASKVAPNNLKVMAGKERLGQFVIGLGCSVTRNRFGKGEKEEAKGEG